MATCDSFLERHALPFQAVHIMTQPPGELVLVRQTSFAQEEKAQDPGKLHQTVHIVVKNQPFFMQVALVCHDPVYFPVFNFHNVTCTAVLVYDTAELKEVDYLKSRPLNYQTFLGSEPNQATLELSISSLSSQHENSLFRVQLKLIDNATRQEYQGISALSLPIKVISKPGVLKRKRQKTESGESRKRTIVKNESIMNLLRGILEQQQEQKKAIEKLTSTSTKDEDPPSFENLFTNLLATYTHIPESVRLERLRKVGSFSVLQFFLY